MPALELFFPLAANSDLIQSASTTVEDIVQQFKREVAKRSFPSLVEPLDTCPNERVSKMNGHLRHSSPHL